MSYECLVCGKPTYQQASYCNNQNCYVHFSCMENWYREDSSRHCLTCPRCLERNENLIYFTYVYRSPTFELHRDTRFCPCCGILIEKLGHCTRVTCTQCEAEFNFFDAEAPPPAEEEEGYGVSFWAFLATSAAFMLVFQWRPSWFGFPAE